LFKERQAAGVAVEFAGGVEAAECEAGFPASLVGRDTARDLVGGEGVEMVTKLFVEIGVERGFAEDSAQTSKQAIEGRNHAKDPVQDWLPGAVRMRSITSAVRRQLAVSAARRLRPRAVRA